MSEVKETILTNRNHFLYFDIANGYKKVLNKYIEACGCAGKAWRVDKAGIRKEAFFPRNARG